MGVSITGVSAICRLSTNGWQRLIGEFVTKTEAVCDKQQNALGNMTHIMSYSQEHNGG
jgi:hypothetical protein